MCLRLCKHALSETLRSHPECQEWGCMATISWVDVDVELDVEIGIEVGDTRDDDLYTVIVFKTKININMDEDT